ncbi:MAG: ABC transporter ATP-binding protein, partial [Christensenellales bacterium]
INFEHVCKYYQTGDTVVKAVDDVNFTVEKGEFCVVLGPSGAGKTTILNLLGGMDKATSGTITVGGKQITGLRGPQLTDYRRTDVGFVFQFYNLMPNLTALENVELARQVCKDALDPKTIMEQAGLGKRMNNFPPSFPAANSSACPSPAPVKNPALLLCDELTGAWIQDRRAGALAADGRLPHRTTPPSSSSRITR